MPFTILQEIDPLTAVIKVIGVGGGGGNAVEHMIKNDVQGIQFITANTDHQALQHSLAHVNIQLGDTGLGAGAKPEIGAKAAEEKKEQITEAIRDAHLLFITAGMGGGTGTGAAPVIARIAKELGILTIGVVTKPFSFEGRRRMKVAEAGIENLTECVDSMIVILNEKLESECSPDATIKECFEMSNEVLYKACVGLAEIIHKPGTINVDFEDLKTIMGERGTAIIGLATASGPNRARVAAEQAISCPLLEGSNLQGARGLLVNFTGNGSLTLKEVTEAMGVLDTFVHKDAFVTFGTALSEEMGDEVRVTLVATGLDNPMPPSQQSNAGQAAAEPTQAPDVWSDTTAPIPPVFVPNNVYQKPAAVAPKAPATPAPAEPAQAAPAPTPAAEAAPSEPQAAAETITVPSFTIPSYGRNN